MAIIVIEGPDGVGKTTLAREFEKRGFKYVHFGPPMPDEDLFETYTEAIINAWREDTVFDRLHVGEMIYGPVMRGKSRITLEQLRLLNRLIFAVGGKVIFCTAPLDKIIENWKARQQQEYLDNTEKLRRVVEMYQDFCTEFSFLNGDITLFDYTQRNVEAWVKGPLSPLKVDLRFMASQKCPPGVIGNPNGKFLILGEKAKPFHINKLDIAFYSHERSSTYLNHALWDAGFHESDLTFTNTFSPYSLTTRDLRTIYYEHQPVVIALGRKAQNECLRQGVPFLPAPHPQHERRFKRSKRKKYVDLLRQYRTGGRNAE